MSPSRRLLTALCLFFVTAVLAHAQAYTSIVVIGDSLSDTGNDTHLSTAQYTAAAALPAPATGYTQGSFTNGIDTSPAARLYSGVWIKQLAALLPARPTVIDSLDGGTNYAYGFAFTGSGTSALTYGPGNVFSINVNNMQTQLASYLATSPTINSKTLFVVWGGANDLLNATSPAAIPAAATNELGIIQSLITAGATDFLVVDLPPLGAIPRLNQTGATATSATAAAAGFNQLLFSGLATLPAANPTKSLHLYTIDVFTLFNTIIASPSASGFANVKDSSQGVTTINPDTYLFWDGLHPTTAGHHLVALAGLAAIAPGATLTTLTSSNLAPNLAASVTFTATVTAPGGGTPPGIVTFYDGTTAIGNAQLTGTANTATFTTTALAAGTHSITAVYTATQYFNASTSAAVSEVVTAPAIFSSINPTSLTLKTGTFASATISVASVGGFTGTVLASCGNNLPAHVSCTFMPGVLAFTGTNNTLTTVLSVNTNSSAALHMPARPGAPGLLRATLACTLLPFFGLIACRRKSRFRATLLTLLLALASAATLGLAGCAGTNGNAATGTITVPVTLSSGTATNTINLSVTITN